MRAKKYDVGLRADVCTEPTFLVEARAGGSRLNSGKAVEGGILTHEIVWNVNLGNAAGCQKRDGQLNAADVLGRYDH